MRCSYGSLLESRASFDGWRTILLMFHGFLAFRKTVAELTCERLRKSLTFFERTEHGTYVYYTIILLLPCAFNYDFVNNLSAINRRNEILRHKIVRFMWARLLASRALSSRKNVLTISYGGPAAVRRNRAIFYSN